MKEQSRSKWRAEIESEIEGREESPHGVSPDQIYHHSFGTAHLPYAVPYQTGTIHPARVAHREFYWTVFDRDQYECPDCGRGDEDVERFEVHHLDRDPLNGRLWNLVGLCKRCHNWRHQGESLSSWSVDEWKQGFLDEEFHPHQSSD